VAFANLTNKRMVEHPNLFGREKRMRMGRPSGSSAAH
jgi:hypothetical protein